MPNYLITARNSQLESAVCTALHDRYYSAINLNVVPGLVEYASAETNQPLRLAPPLPVELTGVSQRWSGLVLRGLLANRPDSYFCGSARNQAKYYGQFATVYALSDPCALTPVTAANVIPMTLQPDSPPAAIVSKIIGLVNSPPKIRRTPK